MAKYLETLLQSIKPDLAEKELAEHFEKLAKEIISNYIIRKGDVTYQFMEIEFYYFNNTKDKEHLDLITYPRCSKAGDWFFHASGVDICFDSQVILDENTGKVKEEQGPIYFGGILIRSLMKTNADGTVKFLTGPHKCCYDVFDKFSAIDNKPEYPVLERKEGIGYFNSNQSDNKCMRYFNFSTSDRKKYDNIVNDNYENKKEFGNYDGFKRLLTKEYRFFDTKAFPEYDEWRKDLKANLASYSAKPTIQYKHKDKQLL